jgi:sorting nexin-8
MTASRRSRDPPSPNSILDRQALIRALDERNISLKSQHIDAFYQSLHRQHYPPLDKFVETYYLNEAKLSLDDAPTLPLKNKLSRKKNRNKLQLPKVLLDFIKDPNNGFVTITSTVDDARTSADGTTTKLAVKLHDGHLVESVLMRYITKGGSRASLCVSSQVGCAMGCTFCATGTMGIKGNLTTGEILEQIVHADRILAQESVSAKENNSDAKNLDLVRNVVFMGMGVSQMLHSMQFVVLCSICTHPNHLHLCIQEPLNNYDNVVEACRGLIDRKRWNLAHGRVTVSTVGVTPKIHQLTRDLPQVCLALSLHAPNQEMRSAIVPAAKAYKIEGLIDALDRHMMGATSKDYNANGFSKEERIRESTRRRAMIEYVMRKYITGTCRAVVIVQFPC